MLVPIAIIGVLWLITLCLIIYAHSKEKANIWYGLFLFTVSLGYFVALIKDFWVPASTGQQAMILDFIGRFLSAFGNRACPYFILQAAIKYAGFSDYHTRKKLNFLLLIPFIGSFLFDLLFPAFGFLRSYIPHSPYFWVTTIWASAYGLFAHFLFFFSWYREKLKQQKKHKLLVLLLNLPTLGILLISYYGTKLEHMWTYNLWPVILIFFLFLYFISMRNGVFGIRLNFQNTMEIASNSTNIINHVIKNDLQVIMNGVELLKTSGQLTDSGVRYTDTILDSAQHLVDMATKIKKHTQHIQLDLVQNDLKQLINQAIDSSEMLVNQRRISIIRPSGDEPLFVSCDAFYLREVFNNLLMNAVEAIDKPDGEIALDITRYKRYIQIRVRDNGCGISTKNLTRILDPFFTTKKTLSNYGLGLPFVCNVIEKHGGTIQVESNEGIGTTVEIHLPFNFS